MSASTDATLTLPMSSALAAGFSAVLPHASRDAVFPVIQSVYVDQRYLTATDRYSLARWEHTTLPESIERHGEEGPTDPDAAVIVPLSVAEWLSKPATSKGLVLDLVLTATSATLMYSDGSVHSSQSFTSLAGYNYPPMARLIPERTDASADIPPVHLSGASFVKIGKSAAAVARHTRRKDEPVRLQFAESDSRFKVAPVLATIDRLTMLLHPSLPAS